MLEMDGTRGMCLRINGAVGTETLQLHRWPLGKPVLYYACEKVCIGMVEFCLKGLSKQDRMERVNTPRKKIKRKTFVERTVPDADETKLQDMKFGLVAENYPLHVAAYNENANVIKFLLGLGANPDAFNWYGQGETALQCAEYAYSTMGHNLVLAANIAECIQVLQAFKAAAKPRFECVLPAENVSEDDSGTEDGDKAAAAP